MTEPFLSVRDLVVSYGDFRAVDGVSFDIDKGQTLAVVGESGCGKSTIARALVRLVTPTSGQIVLDGTDIAQLGEKQLRPLRHRVQMVFQDPYGSLDPHLTAEKIVAEPMRDRSRADRHAEAARLLDLVGLPTSALDRRPAEFSGGQRQRIGIARALATSPDLLVLDEATSALDVSVQAQVLALLADLQRERGLTYLFISHNLGVVKQISDRIVVMRAGRLVETGSTADVLHAPTEGYTRALRKAALDPTTMRGRKPRDVVRQLQGAPA
ncbi:peptide/nickel transport system ATP-binding protein [Klenkia soli]|uniref:Peptide/nickel transport system ATP-binding protein n=1 Tax=Klenkia soli TaxID=1052260 RepID=A0A1H0BKL4_9ACTN|nr:dipeptide/oligopeptide/nickel ABC transporter ATP-binding protein [Klenkia soli]SDN46095.1 peptide/nickel transport system ATP-binding protein [Klenkia soli]